MLVPLLALAMIAAPATVVSNQTHKPERLGQCFETQVKAVETRLVEGANNAPVVGSGSAITLADGHYGVGYDQLPPIDRSRAGDPVKLCVVRLPKRCPKGDGRGIGYSFKNLRTGMGLKLLLDAEHICGGA